jgi:hypothetical protein
VRIAQKPGALISEPPKLRGAAGGVNQTIVMAGVGPRLPGLALNLKIVVKPGHDDSF